MYIVKLKNLIPETSIFDPSQDSLIIDINLLASAQFLAGFYFYIKIFYIALIIGIYLWLMFSPSDLDNYNYSNQPMQNTNNSINKLIKEYGHLLLMLAAFKTADMQYETSKMQAEVARYQSNAEAERLAYEEAKASSLRAGQELSGIRGVTSIVKSKLEAVKLRNDKVNGDLKEFWDTRNLLVKTQIDRANEQDPFKKAQLDADSDLYLGKVMRMLKEQRDGINSSISDLNEVLDLVNIPDEDQSSTPADTNDSLPKDSDIKKSSIIDLDSLNQWMEDLNLIRRIAFAMLLGHTLILSIVINILFIKFGDQFLQKYNLEQRFPKLKGILEYRRKFQRFYVMNGIFIIFVTSLSSITFAVKIIFF